MNKKLHFISGLPRSGSTLLVSLLNQNPRFFAGIHDPLFDVIKHISYVTYNDPTSKTIVSEEQMSNMVHGMIDGYYKNIDRETIFSVNRGWTSGVELLSKLDPDFKIICMVRNFVDVLNSFEHLYKKRGFNYTLLYQKNEDDVYMRTNFLAGSSFVRLSYNSLREAFYGPYNKNLLLVEYEDLVNNPSKIFQIIYDFLGEEYFEHNFNNINGSYEDYDRVVGLHLHKVHSKVQHHNLPMILPPDLEASYRNWEFWR